MAKYSGIITAQIEFNAINDESARNKVNKLRQRIRKLKYVVSTDDEYEKVW